MDERREQQETAMEAGAGARIIREVIRTPTFVELIKTNTTGLEPEKARELVRVLMFEDINLSLSLGGTTPDVVNYLIEAVLEVGRQLDQFPGPLLDAFVDELGARIDREKLAELPRVYGVVFDKVRGRDRMVKGLGALITSSARAVNRAARSDPYFLRDVFANVDGIEVLRASFAVTRSVVLCFFSWATRLARAAAGFLNKG